MTLTPTEVTALLTVGGNNVNLREIPGGTVIGTGDLGDQFTAYAQVKDANGDTWYLIGLPDGLRAWISSQVAQIDPPNAALRGSEPPELLDVAIEGTCDSFGYIITWNDPDQNVIRVEWLDDVTRVGYYEEDIQADAGGVHQSAVGFQCPRASCTAFVVVVDADNNRSDQFRSTKTCP